ncbi:MAG: hypothetical protein KDH88_11545 [Chromatiales bacterium]|nr:hypothetical protein [Chromatiales bacterium]
MKKIPFYKLKWYVGTKIQRDLIVYIISISLISQLSVIVDGLIEDNSIDPSYGQYLLLIIRIVYFGYIVYGFWLSNRIAGPLFRFERHLQEVGEGKTDCEIQFRKSDYGSEIAEAFNRVVKKRLE